MATKNYLDKTGLTYFWSKIKAALPTKTSDLANDSGFITASANNLSNYYTKSQTYSQSETDSLLESISKAKIDYGDVQSEDIVDGSVITRTIADKAVTTAKIADNAVTWAKLAEGSVSASRLASNAVETAKIKDGAVTSAKIDWTTIAPYWKVVATSNTNTVTIPLNYKLYRIRIAGYKSNSSCWGVISCNQATGTTWTYIQGTSSGSWVQAERSVNATNDKAIMDGARTGAPAGVQTWDIAISRTTLTEQNFVATWSTCTTGSNTYNTGRSIFTLTSGTGTMTLYNELASSITWCVEALVES